MVVLLTNKRVVFTIGGEHRFALHVAHPREWVLIGFAGTHAEYDGIEAEAV